MNLEYDISKCWRRLKYRLSRTNLDKLYLVYIRPLFEYACELWDNWGIGNWNNFNWKPPGLLQVYLFSQKLIFFLYRDKLGITIYETEEKETSTFL